MTVNEMSAAQATENAEQSVTDDSSDGAQHVWFVEGMPVGIALPILGSADLNQTSLERVAIF